MADSYTSTSSSGLDQAAWDRFVYFAFRPQVHFMQLADVKPTNQSMPGTSVNFTKIADLAVSTSALSETVDVDAVALSDSQVAITLAEYGNAMITTAKLRATSFVPLNPIIAEVLGANAGQTYDIIFANAAKAGTNVGYANDATSRTTIDTGDLLKSRNFRVARTVLSNANVPMQDSMGGGSWICVAHPYTLLDLQEETGALGWREVHNYAKPEEIMNGEIGKYEGSRVIETTNSPTFVNASNGSGAAGNIDVFRTMWFGRQALAYAYTSEYGMYPNMVQGPVVDKLRRQVPMGWYGLFGAGIFRQESLYAVESAASLANNAS